MRRAAREVMALISPTSCELAVIERGTVIGHRFARSASGPDDREWSGVVSEAGRLLGRWSEELGVRGARLTVVYAGPDTAASVFECAAAAGVSRAALAARMALADSVSFPAIEYPHSEILLSRDEPGQSGEQPRLHTLAVADTESTLEGLQEAVEAAGLGVGRFVPLPGALLAAAFGAIGSDTGDSPRVVVWIGSHASVLVGRAGGRLSFSRLVPAGVETLAQAVGSTGLSPDDTVEMFYEAGLPEIDGWPAGRSGPDARTLLPLLQPVLQRLAVEIKQSVRFGFTQGSRDAAVAVLAGPGAGVAGLAEAIGRHAGLVITRDDHGADGPLARSDLAAARSSGRRVPVLTTNAARAGLAGRRMRRSVAAGAALAVLAIGAHAFESWQRLGEAQRTMSSLGGDEQQVSLAVATVQGAMAARHGLTRAEAEHHRELGSAAPFASLLRALGELTPEGIELSEISMRTGNQGPVCTVRGTVRGDGTESDSARFGRYTAALGACPLVADSSLGETRRTVVDGGQRLDFSLSLTLVELPSTGARAGAGETKP